MDEQQTNLILRDAAISLEFWNEFDLDSKKQSLDKSCVEMRDMKTSSINGIYTYIYIYSVCLRIYTIIQSH